MAYPTSIISFTTHNAGDIIQPADVNIPDTEVVSIEQGLLNGFQHGLKFLTDNTYDIGVLGANRPRSIYPGTAIIAPGTNPALSGFLRFPNNPGTIAAVRNAGNTADFASLSLDGKGNLTAGTDAYFKSGSPWIDVKSYGAVGDGVTDDTTAIQNAINAAGLWSGPGGTLATVYLDPGTYLVSATIALGTRTVWLRGAGQASTVIQLKSASNVDTISVGTTAALSSYGQKISDLTVNQNYTGQTAGNGLTILAGAQEVQIDRVRVINCYADGIQINGWAYITNCIIESSAKGVAANGINFKVGSVGSVTGSFVSMATPIANSAGIAVNSTSLVSIVGNNVSVDGASDILVNNSSQVTVSGNVAAGGPTTACVYAIRVAGGGYGTTVSGNSASAFSSSGIVADGTGTIATTITGNTVTLTGTQGAVNAITEGGTADASSIVGNTIRIGTGTFSGGALSTVGTHTTTIGNTLNGSVISSTIPGSLAVVGTLGVTGTTTLSGLLAAGAVATQTGTSVTLGASAPATTGTAGFPYLPAMAGTPTGVPTTITGFLPVVLDSTGNHLWGYLGGAWKQIDNPVTTVVKKGSMTGTNYTTTSTTFVDVDATNLAYTVTIPVGSKLTGIVSCSTWNTTGGNATDIGVFDSVPNTVIRYMQGLNSFNSGEQSVSFPFIVVGDGASHIIKLQFASQVATSTATIANPTASSTLAYPGGSEAQIVFRLESAL